VRDALFCPECGGIECCDDECARVKRQIAQYKRREREKAERRVIEAARRCVHGERWTDPADGVEYELAPFAPELCKPVHDAVRALDAVKEET